jgi:hypothetical protein
MMTELIMIPLLLRGPCDVDALACGGSIHLAVYDDDYNRGSKACEKMLSREVPGAKCVVLPYRTELVPQSVPTDYTEYDDNYCQGQAKCARDLRQDTNPQSTCHVVPRSEYPGAIP